MPSYNFLSQKNLPAVIPCLVAITNGDDSIYLTDNGEPVTWNDNIYVPCSMRIKLPEQGSDSDGKATIEVSAVDQQLVKLARNADESPTFTIQAMLLENPLAPPEPPDVFELSCRVDNGGSGYAVGDICKYENFEFTVTKTGTEDILDDDGNVTESISGIVTAGTIAPTESGTKTEGLFEFTGGGGTGLNLEIISTLQQKPTHKIISKLDGYTFTMGNIRGSATMLSCQLTSALLLAHNFPRWVGNSQILPNLV